MFARISALVVTIGSIFAGVVSTSPVVAFEGFVWPVVTRHGVAGGQTPDPTTNIVDPTTVPEIEEGWYVWNYFGRPCGAPCSGDAAYPYHPGFDLNRLPAKSGRGADQPVYSIGEGRVIRAEKISDFRAATVIVVYDLPTNVDFQRYALPATTLTKEKRFSNQVTVQSLHLDPSSLAVQVGQRVSRGQLLGRIMSGINHVHFEGSVGSQWGTAWYRHNVGGYYQTLQDITTWGNIDIWKLIQDFQYPWGGTTVVGAGQFKPGEPADETISAAFRVEYARWTDPATGFNKLGAPDPDVYIPWVTEYGDSGIYLQQFHQPDATKDRFTGGPAGTDGWTRLVYGKTTGRAYVVSPIFLTTYAAQNIATVFGAPFNNQHIWTGPTGLILPEMNNYIRQDFALGKTMIAQTVAIGLPYEVHVIDTPPGAIHISVIDGVGGTEPFTLSGWAVSQRQVALTCRGNLELDANGHYAWLRDGVEVVQTALPEFTETGLTPGATYVYRVEAVDDVWGAVDVSNDLTVILPQADVFAVRVTLKAANAVSISVVNQRFAVVWYYLLLRDGVEIARLSGEAYGDFDLDYSRTYAYQVVAMTASHMELGRTEVVTITTQAQPITQPPPMEDARAVTIVLSVDRSEVAALTHIAQATAKISDQYGREMSGRVLFLSSNPAVATIDADRGDILAEAPGTVELHAELYANRDLWSAPVIFTVHTADWTPPTPEVWRAITANQPLGLDGAGRHWSDEQHVAWSMATKTSSPILFVTLPFSVPDPDGYYFAQHFVAGDPNPHNGFVWHPTDGRVGVWLQTSGGCELWVNGQFVGAWGDPAHYGRQPINLPEYGTVNYPSIDLPPVEITQHLVNGVNFLALHVAAGLRAPELRSLQFVNLNAAPIINLPTSIASSNGAVVFVDTFTRAELGSDWEVCGNVGLSPDGKIDLWGDNSCTMCGFGLVAGVRRVNFPAFTQPEAALELFVANNYGGRNNLVYLAFGDFWVGAQDHPQAPAAVQLFYRGWELARVMDVRLASGWYELSVSGGSARFHTLRLQNAGDTPIDLEGSFADRVDPLDPPRIDHLCLMGNELGQISFDDVTVRDLSAPAVPLQTTARPNLVPTLAADDPANLRVTVENRSPTACPASLLSLSVDGTLQRTFTISELAASASLSFSVTLDRLAEGSHTVAVVADSDEKIAESDEDNTATLTFTVAPVRLPDLTVTLSLPTHGYVGDLLPVTVTVVQLGDALSPPFLLNIGFGGTREESVFDAEPGQLQYIIDSLAPGASVTVTSSIRFAATDTFTIWADVDANGEVRESDETNNTATATVVVIAYPLLASLPSPQYALSRTQDYVTSSGQPYTGYYLTCLNWTEYPDVIFRSEPAVVCGSPGAARTWVSLWAVDVYGRKTYLSGYCRFSTAQDLNTVWFGLPRGSIPPLQACVTLTDEVDLSALTSNLVSLPRPSGVDAWDPADNTGAGAVTLSNPTTTEQAHGVHRLSSIDSYDWFKVYLTAGTLYNFNTIGGTGDDYGELYSNAAGTTRVAYNDDSGGSYQFSLTYAPATTGWYYLRVRAYSVGNSCTYTLKYRSL